jgi:hypothetical protein
MIIQSDLGSTVFGKKNFVTSVDGISLRALSENFTLV